MKIADFPEDIQNRIVPKISGKLIYRCLGCNSEYDIKNLLYTCPECKQVLLLENKQFDAITKVPGAVWRKVLDYRKLLPAPYLKGIYRYHEFLGPIIPMEAIVYLGEGHTPLIEANTALQEQVGVRFFFKNDGQNPSASFKDRGMASALSYINHLILSGHVSEILAVCASTGDTSAAAALYSAYLKPHIKSAVLLPQGKITPQQLSQPLGSGAAVFEIPGVFDDCMKVVEKLSDHYSVALLNSKNAWRILGQESYSYEIAQELEYDLHKTVVVVPIGNAGNITAVMSGFIKFYQAGIIASLPKIVGVQSEHADPVYRYFQEPDPSRRTFLPVTVKPSVAQAAMIGNPVSMPRVIALSEQYNRLCNDSKVFFCQVSEQDIMDWQIIANRNGHIVCTHGGECLAGLLAAQKQGVIDKDETVVLDSTAHALKFSGFQHMYFENQLPGEYKIHPKSSLKNKSILIKPRSVTKYPAAGHPLEGDELINYVDCITKEIASQLNLKKLDP